jgi:N-acetylmuramoyl-L-alanine amidase CwlA
MPAAPSLNLSVELIGEGRPNRPGDAIRPTHITIHNTDNPNPGADAKAHSRFVRNTGFYLDNNGNRNDVSWHFTVDDAVAIQQLPMDELGYHAKRGNGKSVGIEVCMHRGIDQARANERASLLVAALMKELAVPIERVVTHKHWTGKACPSRLLNQAQEGAIWAAFKRRVADHASELERPGAPSLLEAARAAGRPRGQLESMDKPIAPERLENDLDHDGVRDQLMRMQSGPGRLSLVGWIRRRLSARAGAAS